VLELAVRLYIEDNKVSTSSYVIFVVCTIMVSQLTPEVYGVTLSEHVGLLSVRTESN